MFEADFPFNSRRLLFKSAIFTEMFIKREIIKNIYLTYCGYEVYCKNCESSAWLQKTQDWDNAQ